METPWGNSGKLREQKLRPGPGRSAAEVAHNQRRRLFAAMVACVAERGYAATRLSDLVETSGVARKSFYALFRDKEECFVAALEEMLDGWAKVMRSPTGTWAEQVRTAAASFAELVVQQPAAARMCLIEAYVVGPAAREPVEEAIADFEARAVAAAVDAGLEGEDLSWMIGSRVGALLEIARGRLHLGREDDLPGVAAQFADFVLSCGLPPEPLRLASRPPTPAPETLDAHGHVERVLRAFAAVVAERGYAEATIEQVVKRASMSPSTFYANFASKEEVLFATIESAGLQLLAAILPSFHRNPSWANGVRGAFGDFFNFLASRPTLARLLLVEVYGAGPVALERREEALRPLEVLLAEGRARNEGLTPIAITVLAGSVFHLAHRQVRRFGVESLPSLAPLCAYLTLAPLIGAKEAAVAANGDGSGRRGEVDPGRLLLSRVGLLLTERKASIEEMADEFGVSANSVREQIRDLEEANLLIAIEEETDSGATETFYHSNMDYVDEDVWERMSLRDRQEASKQIVDLITAEIRQAIELGTFDARVDRHLTRIPLQLDDRGWRDLMAVHYEAFQATFAIQAEAAQRLARSQQQGFSGSSVQILFEVPRPTY